MVDKRKFGLALSGGGYRAAAFHLGTLRKLNELGLLDKVDVLSTISGGSITGAAYCLRDKDYTQFETEMIKALSEKNVIGVILRSREFMGALLLILIALGLSVWLSFTSYAPAAVVPVIILVVLLVLFQFRIFPVSRVIERAYDKFFYHNKKLPDLCAYPRILIGSTNLQSCRPFSFSKDFMGDTQYTYSKPPVMFTVDRFPVSRAVMASSCVPFAFTPISIREEFFEIPAQAKTINPKLVDGGVFDNQGIHKLTQEKSDYNCSIVIVSDAGNRLPFEEKYNNALTLLLRTVNVFMQRIKNVQTIRSVYDNDHDIEIAYLSLPWELENCVKGFIGNLKRGNINQALLAEHNLDEEWIKNTDKYEPELMARLKDICHFSELHDLDEEALNAIWHVGTNLTSLKKKIVNDLIVHAANLTEIQIRLYCPTLFSIPAHEQ